MPGVIDEIKERINIVDVVSQKVTLKKSGRSFKALCPFHTEKTASFYVFPESGTFKCFGCGAGGDIFGFVMRTENMDFGEALRLLAERAGVSLRPQAEVAAEDQARAHLREVLGAAAAYFHNLLLRSPQAETARAYLEKRGLAPATIEGWQLGYALDSWDALDGYMRSRGFTAQDLQEAGLVVEREGGGHYDRFRHRIMFPIRDQRGNLTGFGARALGDELPKYLNSPQTLLFDKSGSLYGIERARDGIRRSGQAVIVEGYMDVLIAHQAGITNVVASLGTALTAKQIAILKKLGKCLVLALDADAAGDEATLRGLEVARDALDREAVPVPTWRGLIRFEHVLQTEIRILALPRGKDPDEVILEDQGQWARLVDEALPVVDFSFKAVTDRLDLRNPRDKAAAVDRLLPIIGEIINDIVRTHYLQKLAALVQVDERTLASRLAVVRRPAARPPVREDELTTAQPRPRPAAPRRSFDDYCLALLLYEPALYWRTQELNLSGEDFPSTENRAIFLAYQAFMQAHDAFDLAAFRQGLDPVLHPRLDALVVMGGREPSATGEDMENALVVSILRGRERRLKAELSELSFLIRSAQEEGDAVALLNLTSRVDALRDDVGRIHRALNERTLLWRSRGET